MLKVHFVADEINQVEDLDHGLHWILEMKDDEDGTIYAFDALQLEGGVLLYRYDPVPDTVEEMNKVLKATLSGEESEAVDWIEIDDEELEMQAWEAAYNWWWNSRCQMRKNEE